MNKFESSVLNGADAKEALKKIDASEKVTEKTYKVITVRNVIDPESGFMVPPGSELIVSEEDAKRFYLNGEISKPNWM